ncbi:MAG: hypothetical protein L3K18_01880 [Thermoplasmata archaeon]|nr:hypothetical protein [Thermoplasmata archaeon]MCI4355879.1 hypothetical protein [Thermoplasmata archaeon]
MTTVGETWTKAPTRSNLRWFAVAIALATSTFVAGLASGGAFSIMLGPAELGAGTGGTGTPVAWWGQEDLALTTVPATVPPLASLNSSVPTILTPSNQSYLLATGTAGHVAVRWNFTELVSAPTATELEVYLAETNQSLGITTYTIFVETQPAALTGAVVISIYLDVGSSLVGLRGVLEVTQLCGSVGSCP